jgi:glycosyltransferase involved in cell wall biosynthesis
VIDRLDAEVPIPRSLAKPAGSFRVLFAGNLGRFQNLETVVDAAKQLESVPQIRFDFVGGGVMKDKLKERSGSALNKSIFFHDHQSLSVAMRVIYESNLAIVSLSPGVIFCAYPSKTMSYLESGCRIMAIVEGESEFAKMIVDSDCGVVCPSGDANVIANQVRQEFERFSGVGYSRHEIRELGQSSFGKEKVLSKWADLFRTLE